MASDQEQLILESWHENAKPWIKAIDRGEIESRIKATNKAIIDSVVTAKAKQVLDIGCGEGWLSRELAFRGCKVVGIDAVAELIKQASLKNTSGNCAFKTCSYQSLEKSEFDTLFDTAVCNFSLLGDESVSQLLKKLPALLSPHGTLLIQTVHPDNFPELNSGWQQGSWQGFNSAFVNAPPWFYRTQANWLELLNSLGYSEVETRAAKVSNMTTPASLIITARRKQPL